MSRYTINNNLENFLIETDEIQGTKIIGRKKMKQYLKIYTILLAIVFMPLHANSFEFPELPICKGTPILIDKYDRKPFDAGDKSTMDFISEYKESNSIEPWDNCLGGYIIRNFSAYLGAWENGQRSGLGMLVSQQDKNKPYIDTGNFVDGYRVGYGFFANLPPTKSKETPHYIEWASVDKEGNVIENYFAYDGEFLTLQSDDKLMSISGTGYYFGDFDSENDQAVGYAIEGVKGEWHYEGEYLDGIQNGEGKFTWSDGAVYIGEYKDGYMHGKGTLTEVDGSIQQGVWKEDEFQFEMVFRSQEDEEFCIDLGFETNTDEFENCVEKILEKKNQ